MYNWTVKRALCHESAHITWTDCNIGSNTIKYPGIVLKGDNSTVRFSRLHSAGHGQVQDTGARIIHIGKIPWQCFSKGVSLGRWGKFLSLA